VARRRLSPWRGQLDGNGGSKKFSAGGATSSNGVRTLASAKGGVLRGLVAARGCHARRKNNGGTDGFSIQAEREKEREQVWLGARRREGGS
jgi:hypothetical protein